MEKQNPALLRFKEQEHQLVRAAASCGGFRVSFFMLVDESGPLRVWLWPLGSTLRPLTYHYRSICEPGCIFLFINLNALLKAFVWSVCFFEVSQLSRQDNLYWPRHLNVLWNMEFRFHLQCFWLCTCWVTFPHCTVLCLLNRCVFYPVFLWVDACCNIVTLISIILIGYFLLEGAVSLLGTSEMQMWRAGDVETAA